MGQNPYATRYHAPGGALGSERPRGSLDGGISEISGNLNDLLDDVDLDVSMGEEPMALLGLPEAESDQPVISTLPPTALPSSANPSGWIPAADKAPGAGSSRFTSRFMTLNPRDQGGASPGAGNFSLFG